jgi:hypothetical protein
LPDDEVTTVVPPLVAMLVVPATAPLPAEIATPLADAAPRPPLDETTAQLPFDPALPVTTVLLEPPELLTVAELELVCATASVEPKQASTPAIKSIFMMELHLAVSEGGKTAARCLPRSRVSQIA